MERNSGSRKHTHTHKKWWLILAWVCVCVLDPIEDGLKMSSSHKQKQLPNKASTLNRVSFPRKIPILFMSEVQRIQFQPGSEHLAFIYRRFPFRVFAV